MGCTTLLLIICDACSNRMIPCLVASGHSLARNLHSLLNILKIPSPFLGSKTGYLATCASISLTTDHSSPPSPTAATLDFLMVVFFCFVFFFFFNMPGRLRASVGQASACSSGYNPRVLGSSPTLDSLVSEEFASPSAPPLGSCLFSLSKINEILK